MARIDTYASATAPAGTSKLLGWDGSAVKNYTFAEIRRLMAAEQYNAQRKPASAPTLWENFVGGAEAGTWRWGNQGGASQSLTLDSSTITTPTETTAMRGRWTTAPGASDYDVYAQLSFNVVGVTAGIPCGGLWFLDQGSEATPTALKCYRAGFDFSLTLFNVVEGTKTSYTSAYSFGATPRTLYRSAGGTCFMRAHYVSGTKVMTYYFSTDGSLWIPAAATHTFTGHPQSVGYFGDSNSGTVPAVVMCNLFVIRSDASGKAGAMGE